MSSTKNTAPLVSILINNYNYGSFLGETIDSALNQTYLNVEVIVVDDGSTDHSRDVILGYGDKIVPVLKENGGQTSAGNAGFLASKGDIICLLDSDDVLYPNKVEVIVEAICHKMKDSPYILIYHLLDVVNKSGISIGERAPEAVYQDYPSNFYEYAYKYKFIPFKSAPTSGISLSRQLAERIFPIPEDVYFGMDDFIVRPAALIGDVYGIDQALGTYRLHGENNWHGNPYPRNKTFLMRQDNFLNQKLKENNKEPVISYFDSHFARDYYINSGSTKDLFVLAFKVLRNHIDRSTIKFFITTIFLTMKYALIQEPKP